MIINEMTSSNIVGDAVGPEEVWNYSASGATYNGANFANVQHL
jgi:hypothetical protein